MSGKMLLNSSQVRSTGTRLWLNRRHCTSCFEGPEDFFPKACILQVLLPRVGAKPALGHRHVVRGAEKQTAGTSGEDKKKSVPKPEGKLEKEQDKESKPQKVHACMLGIAGRWRLPDLQTKA